MKRRLLFFIVFFFTVVLPAAAQIPLVGNITTNGNAQYPTHIDSLGYGGFRVVKDIAERNSITVLRRKFGMAVYVQSDDKIYILRDASLGNSNWLPYSSGTQLDPDLFLKIADTALAFYPYTRSEGTGTPDYLPKFLTPRRVINSTIRDNGLLISTEALHGILATGTYGNGAVGDGLTGPAIAGEGTRLMWIPSKAAFRAGYAGDDKWDSANIGDHSVAFGYRNIAGGYGSFAAGVESSALGYASTALGSFVTASGDYSIAIGSKVSTNDMRGSVIIGDNSIRSSAVTTSSLPNQMTLRFSNGIKFYTHLSTINGAELTQMGVFKYNDDYSAFFDDRSLVDKGYIDGAIQSISDSYIQNSITPQTGTDFNITGSGTIGTTLNVGGAATLSSTLSVTGEATYGASIVAAGSITANSDIRLKTNIKPLQAVSEKLRRLRSVEFDRIDIKVHQLGFIAQEVKMLFPELVVKAKDSMGTLSVNYQAMTAPLLQGWQEHDSIISLQQKEIVKLQTELAELKKMIADIPKPGKKKK